VSDGSPAAAVEIRRAALADRAALQRMLELYQYELSDIWDQDLDAAGEYGYDLQRYWSDPACHGFVATVGGRHAGFALVDGAVKLAAAGQWMDQFFVLKKYRRTGLGSALALQVFAELPGHWEVGQMPANLGAQAFWRRLLNEHAPGRYIEQQLSGGRWEGFVQCFDSVVNAQGPRLCGPSL
jgi:predicted acetyltransferase